MVDRIEVNVAKRTCTLRSCDSKHYGHGYCSRHYTQLRTLGEIIDQTGRTCGWCGSGIEHLTARAQYCSLQHKKNAASKRHRERNPGYFKQYNNAPSRLAYRELNREKLAAAARERRDGWSDERRAAEAEAVKRWWAENQIKHRLYQAKRRTRQANGPGVAERDWLRLVRRYDGRCAYCSVKCDPHMDHVIPLKRGGRHAIGNVLPACGPCNFSKSARLLADWKRRR